MATSGVDALFNLNPLIKLDGYYLLSDWLEIRTSVRAPAHRRRRTRANSPPTPRAADLRGLASPGVLSGFVRGDR
jgi:hypothetical protein